MTENQDETGVELQEAPRMNEDEIKELASDLVKGHLVVASAVPPDLLSAVFVPLALGGLGSIDPESVGNIVENINKAGPRAINGWPMFFSCQIIHKEDWKQVYDRYEKATAALHEAMK